MHTRVVKHWNKLSKEAEDAPSLEAFRARLDVALGSLVWWLAALHTAGGWITVVLFNPGSSMILWFLNGCPQPAVPVRVCETPC